MRRDSVQAIARYVLGLALLLLAVGLLYLTAWVRLQMECAPESLPECRDEKSDVQTGKRLVIAGGFGALGGMAVWVATRDRIATSEPR